MVEWTGEEVRNVAFSKSMAEETNSIGIDCSTKANVCILLSPC